MLWTSRPWWLLVALTAACQQANDPAPATSQPATAGAASSAQAASAPAASAPAMAGEPFAPSEELLQRYLRYERDRLLLVRQLLAQLKEKRTAAAAPASPTAVAELLAAPAAYRAQLEQGGTRLRAEAGLSEQEATQLASLVDAVIMARLAWQQAGGDAQLASIEKRFQARTAALTADQRAPIEAEFRRLIGEVTAMRDAADARRSHGDAAVELVLAHAAELTALREQQLRLGSEL